MRLCRGVLACCLLQWLAGGAAMAVRLPLHRLTSADGLAHDQVRSIVMDVRGFLWFGTLDGLSRYDGKSFRTYGKQNGLPSASVGSLLATRDGVLWVGTKEGLCRLLPEAPAARMFECVQTGSTPLAHSVQALYEDGSGVLWTGTSDGLFRIERGPRGLRVGVVGLAVETPPSADPLEVRAITADHAGCLWIGTLEGLFRGCAGGPFRHFPLQRRERDNNRIFGLLVDPAGRIWAGLAYDGVLVFVPGGPAWHPPHPLLDEARRGAAARPEKSRRGAAARQEKPRREAAARPERLRRDAAAAAYPHASPRGLRLPQRAGEAIDIMPDDGLADPMARGGLWSSADGTIWIGTVGGLCRFAGGRVDRLPTGGADDGIAFAGVEDRAGNLWFGTEHSGALRLSSRGFLTYDREDGLAEQHVRAVFVGADGAVHALTRPNVINRFDGRRFTPTVFPLPAGIDPGWANTQSSFQDSRAGWWIATGGGLLRFPAGPAAGAPPTLYTTTQGLGGEAVFRLYEDAHGDVWIGTFDGSLLTRWERATGTFHRYPPPSGLAPSSPTAFAEDSGGALWIGFYRGLLARYEGGRFTWYPPGQTGLATDSVAQLLRDSWGHIWAACRTGGLAVVEAAPRAGSPSLHLRRYSVAEGLSSNFVTCAVEDLYGRLYVCTGRGVDRLDLTAGTVAHFTLADGLASTEVLGAVRDRDGDLWFATSAGLSRLTPRPARDAPPPPALLMAASVDGRVQPVSQWGTSSLSGLVLRHGENRLEIAFTAIAAEPGEAPRYQHRLAGFDRGWGAPSSDDDLLYAALPPGRYHLLVRALAADGRPGRPAHVAFQVLAPWWELPWVIALAAVAACAAAYAAYRFRLAHLLSLERVRTRIATDLHDEMGANLSRISLLSEVAARGIPPSAGRSSEIVREIGGLARELFDGTADIVWSIDPRRDNLASLVTRLSEYARDVLAPRGASWSLDVPHGLEDVVLGAEPRRELFLLLKEAVHNAARHSGAGAVSLALTLGGGRLRAEVRDDGRGFAAAAAGGVPPSGDGLRNMQARAAALAGRCAVLSAPGRGTVVRVEAPLAH